MCWLFHKWSKWSTPKVVGGEQTALWTHERYAIEVLLQTRKCEVCNKTEIREVNVD